MTPRPVLGEVLDPQGVGARALEPRPRLGLGVRGRGPHVLAGAKPVVEHQLGGAVAIGVELAADVGERVPLRRVLQGQQHEVVAHHVGEQRIDGVEREAEVRAVAAHGRRDARRAAPRIEHAAARVVERQRQAERPPLGDLGDALQHLVAGHVVHATALIVGAELAPVRAGRPVFPALRHGQK
jgi:hypothetical protein